MLNLIKKNNLFKIINNSLINLQTPINIYIWWNLGSMLGMMLLIQIISGLILSMHYCPNINIAFSSIIHIIQDVKYGWILRNIHMNGASLFFMFMFIHIGRNIYYHSYKITHTWLIGTTILMLSMATAFLGYVLPWGQMSFWGATVITNLMSAIPYIGNMIVEWLWGGFSINNATLNRFYSIHFILPFIILFMVILHLFYLHIPGSTNPIGVNSNYNKVNFHPYFTIKDTVGFMILFMMLTFMVLQKPYMLNDPDNFIPANPMNTPTHIQPEWYFLFAYAILRSIPNKLGGVIALMMSICILYFLPFQHPNKMNTSSHYLTNQIMFWMFISSFLMLTWTGSQEIKFHFIIISQINSIYYFLYFILAPSLNHWWDLQNEPEYDIICGVPVKKYSKEWKRLMAILYP